MSDEAQPIGHVLDALGVTATLPPGALVAGAVVLLKTVLDDGTVRLTLCHSDGLSWTERAGMVHVADALEASQAVGGLQPGG